MPNASPKLSTVPQAQRRMAAILRALDHPRHPPTYAELMEQADVGSRSMIEFYLGRLERQGLVERESRKARAIWLTPAGERAVRQLEAS